MRRDQTVRLGSGHHDGRARWPRPSTATRPARIGVGHLRARCASRHASRSSSSDHGELRYELLPPEEGRGFALLPQPSEGDLFFDIEGDPFFEDGLEYLLGVT